jgi:hypothetical protein
MVMSGTPPSPAIDWRLTNVSSHDISGCRYFPFLADLRTATGQPLRYAISRPVPEICAWDDEFHLRPGKAAQWIEPLGKVPIIEPIVTGRAILTIARSSFADPTTDPLCTLSLPVFGVPPDQAVERIGRLAEGGQGISRETKLE